MSYPPPNPNYPGGGGGNPPYNQQQPGSFGPPQGQGGGGQGGNPPGMGYQPPQPGYGAPQGPPGSNNYGSPSPPGNYGQQGAYSSPNQAPNSYNSGNMGMGMGGGPVSPQGHSGMPPMGGPPSMGPGPPNMMGPGPPGSGLGLGAGVSPPANRATFFSTASGAPIPSGLPMGGPPSSTGGGPSPPFGGGMPPPGSMGGPPSGPPGPGPGGAGSFYPSPNQMGGPPGMQGDYQSPPQLYGQGPGQGGPNSMNGMSPAYGSNNDMNNPQNTQRQPAAGSSIFPGGGWGGASTSTKEPVNYEDQGGFNSNTLPLLNEMDITSECNPMFMRATVSKLVVSQAAANASKIPIGTYGLCSYVLFSDVILLNAIFFICCV